MFSGFNLYGINVVNMKNNVNIIEFLISSLGLGYSLFCKNVKFSFLLIIFNMDKNSFLYLSKIIKPANKNNIPAVNFVAKANPKKTAEDIKYFISLFSVV